MEKSTLRRRRAVIIFLVAVGLVGALAVWAFSSWQEVLALLGRPSSTLMADVTASGTIEATTAQVVSLVAARVITVTVREGDPVEAGQVVVGLDDTLLQKQLAAARAEIRVAEAQLALLNAGTRPEELARREAQVAAAKVGVETAQTALTDARAIYQAAQEIQLDLVQAEMELAKAQHLRDAALARAQAADQKANMWAKLIPDLEKGFDVTLPTGKTIHVETPPEQREEAYFQWNVATQEAAIAWAEYQQAEAAVAAAETRLETVRAALDDPRRMEPVVRAETALEEARSALSVAEAALEAARAGPNEEKVATAQANLKRARAAYAALLSQQRFYTLTAPISGRVLQRTIEAGEVAMPGTPLLRLADLNTLRLVVYVSEPQLGRIFVGQRADVQVDAFPNRVFEGRVVRIADEAEFTPKNVQTKEDRVNLVYAVEIRLPNPEGLLKPGMPADVTLRDGRQP